MPTTKHELDEFISHSDSLGGPGAPACQAYWNGFVYQPSFTPDQSLDPFGEPYVAEQLRLYEELAGRPYDAPRDEQTAFDVERCIAAVNPYDHPDPGALATHLQRLSRGLRLAAPRRGDVLLDMGCGWGLSSELAAYLGLRVIAVDINPGFTRLVSERARRGGRAISVITSTFEAFVPDELGDIALFYECLHHAVRPWATLGHLASCLKTGGRVVLAGEPINDVWWRHWGLRLDPLAIYCIRKFGWFESGWSLSFILDALKRAGLIPVANADPDGEIGYTVVARKQDPRRIAGNDVPVLFETVGCVPEHDLLLVGGEGSIKLSFPDGATEAVLNVSSFCPRGLRLLFRTEGGAIVFDGERQTGDMALRVPRSGDAVRLHFDIEGWVPDAEIGNGDKRTLGLHLRSIEFPGASPGE